MQPMSSLPATIRLLRLIIAAGAALGITAARASAQTRPALSFDATVGFGTSRTDGLRKGGGSNFSSGGDLTLALRLPMKSGGGLIVGVNGGTQGPFTKDDACSIAPGGGCLPEHPRFVIYSALGGWEHRSGTLRLMGGVGAALPSWERPALAIQSRIDIAVPVMEHIAMIASVKGSVIPNYQGDTFGLGAIGVGLRIW